MSPERFPPTTMSADCSPASAVRCCVCASARSQQAMHLARCSGQARAELQTPQERRQQAELDRMIQSPHDKATLMQLTDQAFRSQRPHRAADQLIHILDVQGVPRFFSPLDRTLLMGFQSFGAYLPGVAMPFVKERMQQETANVILPAERELLAEHLAGPLGRRRADERQLPRRSAARRGRRPAPAARLSGRAAAARDRSHLGQNLDDLLADLGARPRAHGRRALRPAGAAVPRGGQSASSSAAMARPCRSSSTSTWRSTATRTSRPKSSCARSTGPAWSKPAPASRCRRTSPIRSARSSGSTSGPASASRGRLAGHDPPRERRQHGSRARRSQHPRLAAGAVQDQARNRRQLPADAARRHAAGESRRRAARHRLAQPVHARLRPGAGRRKPARSTACSSKCSKAWPTTSGARSSS